MKANDLQGARDRDRIKERRTFLCLILTDREPRVLFASTRALDFDRSQAKAM